MMNSVARAFARSRASQARRFYATTESRAMVYERTGPPSTVLKMVKQQLQSPVGDQVLVKMLCAPINPADINMIEGSYGIAAKVPAVGGNEGVGVVTEVGPGAHTLKVGDFVVPAQAGFGTWRTHAVAPEKDLQALPIGSWTDLNTPPKLSIPIEYAATISVNPCTALRLLEDFVSLKPGDVVVQNGANSMVGYAVSQIAAARGIKTINVIRGSRPDYADVAERIKQHGGYLVTSDDLLRSPNVAALLADLPAPKLALNCVGGKNATDIARLLAPGGVMVTYGGMSRQPVTVPTSLLIFRDITLRGFWLSRWAEQHSASERATMFSSLFDLISSKKLKLWMERYSFADQRDFDLALARSQSELRDRKVVLMMDEGKIVTDTMDIIKAKLADDFKNAKKP